MEKNVGNSKLISTDFVPEAVVVGGGDYPTHPTPLHWLTTCDKIVCCDGTANQWLKDGKRPWKIVGDGDSLSNEARLTFSDILNIDPDQETNDQTKAVNFLMRQGLRRIAIVGGTGRREDHTIGNISLLMEYLESGLEVRMYTDYGVFIPCQDDCTFHFPVGTAVSIFNFGAQHMASEGLAYPLYDLDKWWQGTLNHSLQSTFTIHGKGNYLIYINYENKKIRD